jgi:hypothetical protein
MRPVYVAAIVTLFAVQPAAAQVTTCRGDQCTIEEADGMTRELSAEEVRKLMRGNSRTAIGNIYCRHASDPDRCENLLSELFALFPL